MTSSSPVLHLSPTQFHRRMLSGRTEPFLIGAVDNAGMLYEVVIKLRGREYGYAEQTCELIGGQLAQLLGLSTPGVALVDLNADFVNVVPQEYQQVFLDNLGANYGSAFIGPGASMWPTGMKLRPAERNTAAAIFAFDVLVQNPDRRVDNPNLLVKDGTFFAIDNEKAFSHLMFPVIGGAPQPWMPGFVDTVSSFASEHVFYRELRGCTVDLGSFESRLQDLMFGHVDTMVRSVPASWAINMDIASKIAEYLIGVGEHARSCRTVVEELLQ